MRGTLVEGNRFSGVHDKAQLGVPMVAVGVKLQGETSCSWVNFETAEHSMGEHRGISYPSYDFGTRWATERGCMTISPWLVSDSTKLELLC